MEKYVTNIKDLVIQTLTNGSEIKAKAENGDALSCFQMGMIHLLGIDTPIDFKKASNFLGNQLLSDDPDANRLLGFIAECEGNYSLAFKYYTNSNKSNNSYINKVFEERGNLQTYLKKLELPTSALNKEITNVINEYIKGGNPAIDAKIKLAYICEDETTCLDAAKAVYESGDYFSAINLLHKGKIDSNNALYASIKNHFSTLDLTRNYSDSIEVIDLKGNSFLTNFDSMHSISDVRNLCDEASALCKKDWVELVGKNVSVVKLTYKEEEATRKKIEKEKEAARIRKEKEEEAARLRKQKAEEEKAMQEALVEEAARKKRNKLIIKHSIICILLFAFGAFDYKELDTSNAFVGGIACILGCYFWYYFIRWIWRGIKNRDK